MGYELDGFLGRSSELRRWKAELASVVVCRLSGELGLVPVTGELSQEFRTRYGAKTEAARLWGTQASTNSTIAYFSAGEFGDQSHERAIVWSNGDETLSG